MNAMNSRILVLLAAGLTMPSLAAAQPAFGPNTIADVAERVTPGVVSIATKRTRHMAPDNPFSRHPMFREFFFGPGRERPQQEMGAGSGVVVSPDGYIVTNNHVIDGADLIKVVFSDGREHTAKLIGTDKPSDVALIKIEARGLPHLTFGDSDRLRLGEFVLAIGNPFGVGQTVTMGIVSAKGRANIGIVDYENFIQTDAAINPGNSGGALVNLEGQLVGINTAILSRSGGAQGIGFAVPSKMVRPILDQIREFGRVRRGWLGVAIQDLSPELATSLGLGETQGVLISDVMGDGPAAKAGMKERDIVTKVNGQPVKTSAELRNRIALLGPSATASLSVLRDGKAFELSVKLDEKKDGDAEPSAPTGKDELGFGLGVQPLTPEIREQLEAPPRIEGVVVSDVEPGSPAAEAGLRPGDILTSVNRRDVKTPEELTAALATQTKALLRVYRGGSAVYVVLRK